MLMTFTAVLLKEILTRDEPWPTMSNMEVAMAVANKKMNFEVPENIPILSALMKDCFAFSPQSRPDFELITSKLQQLSTDETGNISGLSQLTIV
jgi:hypothetical protein